jgi:hypothetical protein
MLDIHTIRLDGGFPEPLDTSYWSLVRRVTDGMARPVTLRFLG